MLAPGLIQRQSQSPVMTPQLRQAIALLQMTQVDLAQHLQQIAEQNPLLVLERADTAPAPEAMEPTEFHDDDPERFTSAQERPETAAPPPSLRDGISQQIRLSFPDPTEQAAALYLLDCLDDAGRLPVSITDLSGILGFPAERLEAIRQTLLFLEPVGIFARSLEECLAAQLRVRNRLDPAMEALLGHLDLLARRDWRKLREKCSVEQSDLLDMLAEIQRLDPRPSFDPQHPVQPVEPDLIVRAHGTGFRLSFNARLLPTISVDMDMQGRLDSRSETGRALLALAGEAQALVRAMENRRQSILKIGAELVKQQAAFLHDGLSALRPLTMQDVASRTGLHDSTVSRIVNGKYMDTPRGILPLRMFFSTALPGADGTARSAGTIQHRIRTLIANEGKDIMSDDALTACLQKEGFSIQRRTVAKYREGLGLAKSSQRRRMIRED
ncbi:RNA polymerase factor sigma-54 [Gluconobacter morbifer]|uniref:RNA polymerase sigma-54 factor n=1 Tax=Gluconobacter morbifer G707 TaxID=1088869 RepID=G6XGD5_9PROT|nr:RNA polymerase factor sigma-54 [Gluconobacter morbifer]EHH69243.1 RNA polymerase sigma-54 factor RpoN [Gluconobacter morbifer G707]